MIARFMSFYKPGVTAREALDSTHQHAGSFEPAEGTKKVPLNPNHPDDKALQVSATLNSK